MGSKIRVAGVLLIVTDQDDWTPIFVGLLCYRHIKRKLPNTMTDDEIKSTLKELTMVIATENGSLQFKLANLNEGTRPVIVAMNSEGYLPG